MALKSTANNLTSQGSVAGTNGFPSFGLRHFWRFEETGNTSQRLDAVGACTLTAKNSVRPHPIPRGLTTNKACYFNSGNLTALTSSNGAVDVKSYSAGFSAGGWIKPLNVSGQETYDCLVGAYTSSGGGTEQWMIYKDSPGGYWQGLIGLDDGTYISTANALGTASVGVAEWNHLILTMDYVNRVVRFYQNGTLYHTVNYAAPRVIRTMSSIPLSIGAYATGGSAAITHSHSIIAGVGIWDRPLTQQEVINLYNGGEGLVY